MKVLPNKEENQHNFFGLNVRVQSVVISGFFAHLAFCTPFSPSPGQQLGQLSTKCHKCKHDRKLPPLVKCILVVSLVMTGWSASRPVETQSTGNSEYIGNLTSGKLNIWGTPNQGNTKSRKLKIFEKTHVDDFLNPFFPNSSLSPYTVHMV